MVRRRRGWEERAERGLSRGRVGFIVGEGLESTFGGSEGGLEGESVFWWSEGGMFIGSWGQKFAAKASFSMFEVWISRYLNNRAQNIIVESWGNL